MKAKQEDLNTYHTTCKNHYISSLIRQILISLIVGVSTIKNIYLLIKLISTDIPSSGITPSTLHWKYNHAEKLVW